MLACKHFFFSALFPSFFFSSKKLTYFPPFSYSSIIHRLQQRVQEKLLQDERARLQAEAKSESGSSSSNSNHVVGVVAPLVGATAFAASAQEGAESKEYVPAAKDVQKLLDMGFPPEKVKFALQKFKGG